MKTPMLVIGLWLWQQKKHDRVLYIPQSNPQNWASRKGGRTKIRLNRTCLDNLDLFDLSVQLARKTSWLLAAGVQCGGPDTGSAPRYFFGAFDGTTFKSENPKDFVLGVGFYADDYAAQFWNNEPNKRFIMIAGSLMMGADNIEMLLEVSINNAGPTIGQLPGWIEPIHLHPAPPPCLAKMGSSIFDGIAKKHTWAS